MERFSRMNLSIDVQAGVWKIFDCASHAEKGFGSCYGINDATIYGFPIILPMNLSKNKKFNPSTITQLKNLNQSQLTPMFTLKKNEAIIIIGKTPPPCLYWGFTPYLHKRKYVNDIEQTEVNASLTDTYNMQIFKETFDLDTPFFQNLMLIVGKNPIINNYLFNLKELRQFKLDNFNKQIMPLPTDIIYDDDVLTILSRVTYIQKQYEQDYKENPTMFVFKVTVNLPNSFLNEKYYFSEPSGQHNLINNPKQFYQRLRDTNIDEKQIVINNKTIQTILNQYNQLKLTQNAKLVPIDIFSVSLNDPQYPIDTGYTCVNHKYDCFFDNRDTVYSVTLSINTLNATGGVVVFGVNHVNTSKAIYTNINIYDAETFTPFFDILLDKEPTTYNKDAVLVKNYKYFYEIYIPYSVYRTHKSIMIAERAYLQSIISSSFSTLVMPMVYVLPSNVRINKCNNKGQGISFTNFDN